MKKIISLSGLFFAAMIFFSSCGQYDEGPMLSLRSKEARLVGTYKVVEVMKNGAVDEDYKELMSYLTFVFDKDGTGEISSSYTLGNVSYTGTEQLEWMFNTDETKLLIRTKDEDDSEWSDWAESTIIRLTDTEIWTQEYEGDDLYEIHYEEI